jgi:hypothetical protein
VADVGKVADVDKVVAGHKNSKFLCFFKKIFFLVHYFSSSNFYF